MKNAFRKRFDFSKIPATIQIPNLIEVQKRSYDRFLQMDKLPSEREDGGLQAAYHNLSLWITPLVTGSASADISKVCITFVPLVRIADPRSSPTRSTPAKCCAASAAPTTPTRPTSATSAATRLACS
jgi:DNA-directed RNA polymerase beta subunit